MITELVLLLGLMAFLVGPILFGDKGPVQVFKNSGPRLAARVERHIAIGREFKVKDGSFNQWQPQDAAPPDGKL